MVGRFGSSCRTSMAGKAPNGLGPSTISDIPIVASGSSGVITSPVTYGVKSVTPIRSDARGTAHTKQHPRIAGDAQDRKSINRVVSYATTLTGLPTLRLS